MADDKKQQFHVWVISGRDITSYNKGKRARIKFRPWKMASFDTQAEQEACKKGVKLATIGSLTSVAFLSDKEAREIDSEVCARLKETYPEIVIKEQR